MSNNLTVLPEVPQHLTHRIGTESSLSTQVAGGLGGSSVPRISIKSSRFRLLAGDTEVVLPSHVLNVVIVGANPSITKTWYEKKWTANADDNAAPDCFSLNGLTPHPEATQPQNDSCATCPNNAWGSKISDTGKDTKACSDQKRLAVVAALSPDADIYLLQVTPSALKNLNTYQRELSARNIPAEIVKTQIGFDPEASYPKLTFKFAGFLDEATQSVVDKLFGSSEVKAITGESNTSTIVNVKLPDPKGFASEVEVEVEVEVEPKAKTKTKTKTKPKLKAVEPKVEPEIEPEIEPESNATELGFGFGSDSDITPTTTETPTKGISAKESSNLLATIEGMLIDEDDDDADA